MIKINNLNLIIKKTAVLNNINLYIHEGEIVGITGPSGCGKSSLLKAVCGKIKTDPGMVGLNGRDLSEYKKRDLRRFISLLSAPYEFNPEATIFEEAIRGRIHLKKFLNPYSETDRDSTCTLLDEIGISGASERRIKRSSESLVKMALIARTLNAGTAAAAFDSPECGLDPAQKLMVIRAIKKYTARGDKTVLIASADLDFLVKVCDRIIVLKDGSIYKSGGNDIITEELMKVLFGIDVMIVKNIITGLPEIHVINSE